MVEPQKSLELRQIVVLFGVTSHDHMCEFFNYCWTSSVLPLQLCAAAAPSSTPKTQQVGVDGWRSSQQTLERSHYTCLHT